MSTRLADVPTPALVLDRAIMRRNIARMASRAAELGVPLRPHGKTPKCARIADALFDAGALGLTVSTLAEAEAYFDGGARDLFYAVALAPQKAARAVALMRRGADLKCLIDNPAAVRQVGEEARAAGVSIPLVIEIDVDGYRTGIRSDTPGFLDLARTIDSTPGVMLAGIMSYGGASYGCTPPQAAILAEAHRAALVAARDTLATAGLGCPIVSFGSSPAVLHARSMDGVTELRCGIYIFQDLFQAAIGACAIEDVALSVLATVIGVRPDLNRIVVDAGGLAMSKDLSTARTDRDAGYGLVCDESGTRIDDVYMATTSQELGLLSTLSGRPLPFDRMPVGTHVRILPNHADMTAAAYRHYHVVEGDDVVIAQWERANGW